MRKKRVCLLKYKKDVNNIEVTFTNLLTNNQFQFDVKEILKNTKDKIINEVVEQRIFLCSEIKFSFGIISEKIMNLK